MKIFLKSGVLKAGGGNKMYDGELKIKSIAAAF